MATEKAYPLFLSSFWVYLSLNLVVYGRALSFIRFMLFYYTIIIILDVQSYWNSCLSFSSWRFSKLQLIWDRMNWCVLEFKRSFNACFYCYFHGLIRSDGTLLVHLFSSLPAHVWVFEPMYVCVCVLFLWIECGYNSKIYFVCASHWLLGIFHLTLFVCEHAFQKRCVQQISIQKLNESFLNMIDTFDRVNGFSIKHECLWTHSSFLWSRKQIIDI